MVRLIERTHTCTRATRTSRGASFMLRIGGRMVRCGRHSLAASCGDSDYRNERYKVERREQLRRHELVISVSDAAQC